jgi:hypothetical protein
MKHEIADNLEAIVHDVEPRLRAISNEDASAPLRAGGWSAKQLLGHLIDSASNNHQRFVRLQQSGDIKLAGYDQEYWVESQGYAEADWPTLVSLWASYNLHLAHVVRRIGPETLGNLCEVAPGKEVTLDYFVDDYLRHLEHHLGQMGVSDQGC